MIGQILFLYFAAYAYADVISIIPTFPQEYKGYRYSLLFHDDGVVNYTMAQNVCRKHGARLISFHSLDEVEFVKGVEKSNLSWIEDTWMGLGITVTSSGRTYKWDDGTRFDFKNFAPGEPKDLGLGKFCAQIIYKKDEQFGKWKIANCSAKMKAYTCRKPSDGKTWGTPAPVDDSEGTDFPHKFEQHQYVVMYVAEKVNFLQARLKCEDMNANLASLHSRGEIEFLKSVMQSNSTLMEDAWIGMVYNVTDTNAHTTWIDGSSYDYRYTAPGEPKYLGKGEYCGQTIGKEDNISKWKVVNCSDVAYTFVCKKPWVRQKGPNGEDIDPKFPHDFKGNKYAVVVGNRNITFVRARIECEDMGGKLASIHSKEEVEFLKGLMQSHSSYMEDSWIGLLRKVTDVAGENKWVDNTPFDYRDFGHLEPKYEGTGDFCGQIITNGDELSKWKVVKCDKNASAYVCKKAGSGKTTGGDSSGPDSEADRTKGPFVEPLTGTGPFPHEFKGNKYGIFYDPEKVTFLKARLNCRSIDGELASIHSKEEVEFLKSIVQLNSTLMEDAWIGMVYNVSSTDVQKKWVDESAFDYSNFAPLEPKFSEDGVYCGQIMTNGDNLSKWKVERCNETAYTFVCKKLGSKTSKKRSKSAALTDLPTAPPTLPPPEETTKESDDDIPEPDPTTYDPDPTNPDPEVPRGSRPVQISDYDRIVKEKGCYPV